MSDGNNVHLTHDSGISMFESADGVVDNDGREVSFQWDEQHVVTIDAPSNLEGAFDTNRFYKIDGATIARPIKQTYTVDGELQTYKKPAAELDKWAWTFDNRPYTLTHPNSGMVRDVADIHGFWRNPRYDSDAERLLEDLYIPVDDDEAQSFVEDNTDVSVGFYNRVTDEYDGDTGDLTDEDGVDGYQYDMYGNHVAGVKRGRCSGEDGCGLDADTHGHVIKSNVAESVHNRFDSDSSGEHPIDTESDSQPAEDESDNTVNDTYQVSPITTDYEDDGDYYAVAPDENADDEPKFPINNCSDVGDAWHFAIRERGDIDISFSTLKNRIQERARNLDCDVPTESDESEDSDCGCNPDNTNSKNMTDDFDLPDISVDRIAEENDAVAELREQRDSLEESLDELRTDIRNAFDDAKHVDVIFDEDECPCEAVEELAEQYDEAVDEVEELGDELEEYRADEKESALDELVEYGADRDEWEDESLDTIESEIDRREEVLSEADSSLKNADSGNETTENETDAANESYGKRSFGRGYNAE